MASDRNNQGKAVEPGLVARLINGVKYVVAGVEPDTWFGPGQPIEPTAQEVQGRGWDYPVGFNYRIIPRQEEVISFDTLRAMAVNLPILAAVIETRKDQMMKLPWNIVPNDLVMSDEEIKDTQKELNDEISELKQFYLFPNKEDDYQTWARMYFDDLFVIDAATLFARKNRGGGVYAFENIDGALIKRVLNKDGRTPDSNSVAYQQILHGLPAVDYSRDELIYKPRNKRTWKIYGYSPVEQIILLVNMALRRELSKLEYYCYSDDTEVLTKRGWLKFSETNNEDEFATRQIGSGLFEWQQSFDFFRKEYDGEMVEIKGRSIDLLVTPNHRMLVDGLPKNMWPNKMRPKLKTEHVVSAEDLLNNVNETKNGTKNIGIPQTSVWHGVRIKEKVFVGGPKSKVIVMDGDDYCAFMGMYLAEGSVRRNGICIAQPIDHRSSHHFYKTLLAKIFTNVSFSGGDTLEVTSKAVADFLLQFGNSHEKFIPEDIRNATVDQMEIFWDYYYLGDGRADGDNFKRSKQVFTVSKKLADQLTEIIQKMGYCSTTWIRQSGKAKFWDRTINSREGYLITLGRRKVTKGWHAKRVNYKGFVTCVSVPNTFLYVRRNGKQAWSGNTSGTLPDAIVGLPETWTATQILKFQNSWDDLLSGNLAERRKARFVPGKVDIHSVKEAILKDEFDEWIARLVCYTFSVSALPFIKQTNRSVGQNIHQMALQEGLIPLKQWNMDMMNLQLWKYHQKPHLKFIYTDEEDVDPEVQATIDDNDLKVAVKTIDEVRRSRGLDPYPNGLGSKPLIYTATGAVLLEDVISGKLQENQMALQQARVGPMDNNQKQIEDKRPGKNGNGNGTGNGKVKKSDIEALYKVKKKSFSLEGKTYLKPNRNSTES